MAGERNAEADGDGKIGEVACAAEKRGKFVRERVLGTGHAGAGDDVEKAGGCGRDDFKALVAGGRSGQEDCVEMMSVKDAAVVGRLFEGEIGGENAVGAGFLSRRGEFFKAHLEDRIEIAEEDEGNLAGLANAAYEVEDTDKRCAGSEGTFRGALDGRAVG